MATVMQLGIISGTVEASPSNNFLPIEQQYNSEGQLDSVSRYENERNRQERAENKKHEHEMRRRPSESMGHWRARQHEEQKRHERALHKIRQSHNR